MPGWDGMMLRLPVRRRTPRQNRVAKAAYSLGFVQRIRKLT
jgi:hypothetical protein